MATVVMQIRNVPQHVQRTLEARAVLAGKSLSAYVREQLVAMAAVPSDAEIRARLDAAEPFAMKASSASVVRTGRGAA